MKYVYVLLDFGGSIESEALITEARAKALNADLWENEPRFLRWVKKI